MLNEQEKSKKKKEKEMHEVGLEPTHANIQRP